MVVGFASDLFVCSCDLFTPTGFPCPALMWGCMSSLITRVLLISLRSLLFSEEILRRSGSEGEDSLEKWREWEYWRYGKLGLD